ncbi:MAG: rhodanese-like domain-containing protein [Verrucomicrobia bacterium]|nr:rhodanese-like domain-containing protein [Verrucomicrobiota bacterium]
MSQDRRPILRLLRQSAELALFCAAFGLAANWLSPRGLRLTRDYFPGLQSPQPPAPAAEATEEKPPQSAASSAQAGQAGSIRMIGLEEARRLWESPEREAGLVLFLDARSPEEFAAGHIPGAQLFYHYRAEAYLDRVLPLCEAAEAVVVYCSGGACEDSQFAAAMLTELGVPSAKLRIFQDGARGWREAGLPLEAGPNDSAP